MSTKSFVQILILLFIGLIIGGVYFKYFNIKKNIVEEINTIDNSKIDELEKKISDLEIKNNKLIEKIDSSKNRLKEKSSVTFNAKDKNKNTNKLKFNKEKLKEKTKEVSSLKNTEMKKKEIKNLVKDVEYTSVDQKGNKFYLLANSGKSNMDNKDILDLDNVRGKIISEFRDTIYIVSDFAQYNSSNLNSKFYENVIINYQDKEITCLNFDINMETNKALAYNDVIITDPNSVMKAGIVEFDLKTKNIEINPESAITEIKVITN